MLSIRKWLGLAPEAAQIPPQREGAREAAAADLERGTAAENEGALSEAVLHYRRSIAADPEFGTAHMYLGTALLGAGEIDAALEALRRSVTLAPDHAPAHYNLALACLESGAPVPAEVEFRAALKLQVEFPEAWVGLAEALESLGRDEDALAALDTAIAQREHYVGALINSSLLLKKLGRHAQAEQRLHQVDPLHLFASGRFGEAEAVSRQLISVWPDHAPGWKVFGAALAAQRRFEEALDPLQKSCTLLPADAEARHNLAIVLQALGRHAEAEAAYRRAIELDPVCDRVHHDLGGLLQGLGRHVEAEASCRRALELDPDFYEAHSTLGNVLAAAGRLSDALASYEAALKLKPGYHPAHNNLGAALVSLGRLTEAEACFRRALELKPDYREAHDNLLFLLNYHPDKTPAEVFSAYLDYEARFGAPLRTVWRAHDNERSPDRRLRVGYVSPDLRRHAVGHFVEPLFERHDTSAVELFAYSGTAQEDEVSARMRSHVQHWIRTDGMGDAQMAERIRADRIDILVDLAGHTQGNRLPVFARKPAPVSVTTIGYGYTTGLRAIDWFMSDPIVVPAGVEAVFSEGLWRIPVCQVYRPGAGMGAPEALPAIDRGYVTFGSLTRAVRLNPRVVRTWARILRRVPGSKLCIDSLNFRDSGLRAALAAQFAAHGVAEDRLELGFHSPPWNIMRGFDISLDCFPQNSGTTLFDSVYMGIPFVTLTDRPSLGRLGASIATHAGHPEWIASSEEEYADIAVALARDLDALSVLRAGLREQTTGSALMDETAYARQVERAYRGMWQQWCAA